MTCNLGHKKLISLFVSMLMVLSISFSGNAFAEVKAIAEKYEKLSAPKLNEVMPFDNTLFTMDLTGADIKKVIENGDEYDFSKGKNKLDTNIPVRDALVNELKASKKLSLVKRNYLQEEKKVEGPTIPVIPQKSVIYTVKSGDTLYSIGAKYNVDYKEIGEINNMKNLNLIFVGEKLIIPQN